MIVFGPVPSRRLGQSVGINNIPPKACSYSCIYCQLGRTNRMQEKRREFYKPEDICGEVETRLQQLKAEKRHADYLSFVPDGEPTLDINLGKTISLLKPYHTKIAVITNASLMWMDEVREALMGADWVSVSVDAADADIWRRVDRPHGSLDYRKISDGIVEFSKAFKGTLVTETMLVGGINDDAACVESIAELLAGVRPQKAYLLVPTRPPAESGVKRPSAESLRIAAAIIRGISGADVECITGDEKEEGFFLSENIAGDLLSIAAVHPVRADIVARLAEKRNGGKALIEELIRQGRLTEFRYEGKRFYKTNSEK